MEYHKLVRDNIPDIISAKGGAPVIHTADDTEFETALFAKVQEELNEFKVTPNAEEMADIMEVLQALQNFYKLRSTDVELARQKKFDERGGFDKKIILESTG